VEAAPVFRTSYACPGHTLRVNRHRLLLILGISILLLLAPVAAMGDLGVHAHALLTLWLLSHACYLAAAWMVLRPSKAVEETLSLWFILGIGLAVRLVLIPTAPTLSEDVYRYLWDGRLVAHGVNPFPRAPDDPSIASFRDSLFHHLNHVHVPTIYPPAAQFLFGAVAWIHATPWTFKAALLLFEIALWIALLTLFRRRSIPRERLLLLAWNPLVILESYGSGHLDLVTASLFVATLALLEARRPIAAGAAFALSTLTKYTPLLLVPYLTRKRQAAALAVAGIVAIALYFPFLAAGPALWTGLRIYMNHWDFNGSLYLILRGWIANDRTVRMLLAGALGVATLAISVRARSAEGAATGLWIAYLIASPTVFPWYVVPLVALLPLCPNPAVLVFSGLVALSYALLPAYRATGVWRLPVWVPWVEYGGAALAAGAVKAMALRGARHGTESGEPPQARRAAWVSERPPT